MADEFVSQLARRSYLYKIEFQWQKNPDAILKTMNNEHVRNLLYGWVL